MNLMKGKYYLKISQENYFLKFLIEIYLRNTPESTEVEERPSVICDDPSILNIGSLPNPPEPYKASNIRIPAYESPPTPNSYETNSPQVFTKLYSEIKSLWKYFVLSNFSVPVYNDWLIKTFKSFPSNGANTSFQPINTPNVESYTWQQTNSILVKGWRNNHSQSPKEFLKVLVLFEYQ